MPTAYGDQPAVGGQGYGGQSAGLGFEVSFYASLPKICISLYKSLFYISTHDHKIIFCVLSQSRLILKYWLLNVHVHMYTVHWCSWNATWSCLKVRIEQWKWSISEWCSHLRLCYHSFSCVPAYCIYCSIRVFIFHIFKCYVSYLIKIFIHLNTFVSHWSVVEINYLWVLLGKVNRLFFISYINCLQKLNVCNK